MVFPEAKTAPCRGKGQTKAMADFECRCRFDDGYRRSRSRRGIAPAGSAVVPVHDEAGSLSLPIERVEAVLKTNGEDVEVIVDDRSRDETLDVLLALLANRPWLRRRDGAASSPSASRASLSQGSPPSASCHSGYGPRSGRSSHPRPFSEEASPSSRHGFGAEAFLATRRSTLVSRHRYQRAQS